MPKYFQCLSRLQYAFHLLAIFLIATNSLQQSQLSVSRVGLGVAMMGIGFTVGSLSDIGELSKRDRKTFSSRRRFLLQTRGLLTASCLLFCFSLLSITVKFVNPSLDSGLAGQYANLGYGLLALAFGIFFELKQVFEKHRVFMQRKGIDEFEQA